ncbi:hypothetical protein N431DRAFT_444475 [Stipitochalara longipes BDJ]|nr:hypothetical protein N431DRAFT_444475 [Stipitochalara longipes BDJ]
MANNHLDRASVAFAITADNQNNELENACSQDLDTFTPFPKLPIDLKLKIWRFTFPSCRRPEDLTSLLVTLRINKESREEVLKKYSVILRNDYYQDLHGTSADVAKEWKKPLSYNAHRDVLEINFFPVRLGSSCTDNCFSYLQAKNPRVLLETRVLEISNWDWVHFAVRINYDGDDSPYYLYIFRDAMNVFLYFRNLEAVNLLRTPDHQSLNLIQLTTFSSDEGRLEVERMRQWFEQNKEAFAKGIPNITIED